MNKISNNFIAGTIILGAAGLSLLVWGIVGNKIGITVVGLFALIADGAIIYSQFKPRKEVLPAPDLRSYQKSPQISEKGGYIYRVGTEEFNLPPADRAF